MPACSRKATQSSPLPGMYSLAVTRSLPVVPA